MSRPFNLYPIIDNKLANKAGIRFCELECAYTTDGNDRIHLKVEKDGNRYSCEDEEKGIWNATEYGMLFRRKIEISNPSILFGTVVPSYGAKIGVALIWGSTSSGKRGVIELGEFDRYTNKFSYNNFRAFKKQFLRDKIMIEYILYLKELKEEDGEFANIPGNILYTLGKETIYFKGNISDFPIYVYDGESNDLLWQVIYDGNEPNADIFSESVKLLINGKHENYNELKLDENIFGSKSFLFKEMIACFYIDLINTIIEAGEKDALIDYEKCNEYTVCDAVSYFVKTFNIDISNVLNISKNVRTAIWKVL